MKRFLLICMSAFLLMMIILSVYEREDHRTVAQKLERAMRLTRMKEYHNEDFGYTVRVPSFFEQTEDSLMEKGCCRFSFWQDSTEIVQTVFIERNQDSLTLEQTMEKYASDLHATWQQKGEGCFILSGHLFTEDGRMTSRRYYAKFVKHRKLWFVQTLAYPEDCEQAVQRLIREIHDWLVWE
ncbi:MAG: hypothetical protein IJ067_02825 [Prevotella sp.]|nr:hypothetical protein [Prevotella sp.]